MRRALSRRALIRLEWHGNIVAGWARRRASDAERRKEVDVPKEVQFQTKPQIELV
jgi:hypothetical protein